MNGNVDQFAVRIVQGRLYILQELIPELGSHFKSLSVDAHMYSSQWFLTLFTAKFPLGMVYRVIDLFLSEVRIII